MNRWITATRNALLTLFVIASLGAAAYEWWYVWPVRRCDQAGAWWDPRDHQCLDPIPIWRVTGRLPQPPAAKAPAPASPKR
jgi:hypothetical protein